MAKPVYGEFFVGFPKGCISLAGVRGRSPRKRPGGHKYGIVQQPAAALRRRFHTPARFYVRPEPERRGVGKTAEQRHDKVPRGVRNIMPGKQREQRDF